MVRIRIRIWLRNQNRDFSKSDLEPDPELIVLDPQHCFKSDPEPDPELIVSDPQHCLKHSIVCTEIFIPIDGSNIVGYWFRWWC
jgi:hypothetical protein